MSKRIRWPTILVRLALLSLLMLGLFVMIETQRAARAAEMRARVNYWIRGMDWWIQSDTEAENQRRQVEGLRSLGDTALKVLERDLQYDPKHPGVLRRIPIINRLLPQPPYVDEPEEVRHRAAWFLGQLGTNAVSSVPRLLVLAQDDNARVRDGVAMSLGQIGVDSPKVRKVLAAMAGETNAAVTFTASLSLWNLDRSDSEAAQRVTSLISTANLSHASIRLIRLGSDAEVFAPTLLEALRNTESSYPRIQTVHAYWLLTGDKPFVLGELKALTGILEEAERSNPGLGRLEVERLAGYCASKLDDEREFRDQVRSMLGIILQQPRSNAHRMAEVCLERFEVLDHR